MERIGQGIVHLPGAAEDIGSKVLLHFLAAAGQRCRVHQVEMGIIHRQSLLEQVQNSMLLDQPVVALQQLALPVGGIVLLELGQLFPER